MGNSSDKHDPSSSEPGVRAEGIEDGPHSLASRGAATAEIEKKLAARQSTLHPQTCCPNCRTVFEVSSEHLASSDTRVRCGECLSIFDALINLQNDETVDESDETLVDEHGNAQNADSDYSDELSQETEVRDESGHVSEASVDSSEPAGARSDTSALDVTYSDYDLFSGEAGLPDVAYFDQTQDIDSLRFDEPDGDETFSDTLFVHDMTVAESTDSDGTFSDQSPALEPDTLNTKVDFVTDDVPQEPVVFKYRDPDVSGSQQDNSFDSGEQMKTQLPFDSELAASSTPETSGAWMTRALLALLIVLLTAGLYGYRNRDAVLQNPQIHPWLAKACSVVGCRLDPLSDLDALKVLKRAVFSHPTIDNALVIDLAFVNQANFDQPHPVLEIRLTNSSGGLVVQNNVAPADYLDEWESDDLLVVGERLDLSLTVEDPGQTASSFELKFR